MFTIAGILADEEPKTAISPNGLYNTSILNSIAGASFSQDLLSGKSEFTIMYWAYIDSATGTFFVNPYSESTAIGTSQITVATAGLNQISVSLKNSNGGTTALTTSTVVDYEDWFHICITGSVSNNRVRAYYNGVLQGSAVMTYSNATATGNSIPSNSSLVSFSQFNVYNRELSESEVAEHYVDQNGQVGVLAYDAMTTAQRSGLIYCASLTDEISFAGNEFKDRSTNNISLSSNPPLTGEQIYVYTSLSQTYAVNSANLNGSTQRFELGQPSQLDITGNITVSAWINLDDASSIGHIISRFSATNETRSLSFYVLSNNLTIAIGDSSNPATFLTDSTFTINTNTWYFVTATLNGTDLKIYVNGQDGDSTTHSGGMGTPNVDWVVGGSQKSGEFYTLDGSLAMPMVFDRALNSSEVTTLYNNGTPLCYAGINTSITNDCVYAPRLANYNGNNGQELIDQSSSGITTTNIGSTPFTGTGLNVECST